MKIGIDCRNILNVPNGEKAGVGHYTYYLVKNLLKIDKKNKYILFFDHRVINTNEFKQKNSEIIRFPYSQYKKYLPFGYSHWFVTKMLNKMNLDVFHAPANIMPLTYKKPTVITVHDLAIYYHPEWFPPKQKFSTKISVPQSIKMAKKIIAVSKSTQKSIENYFHVSPKKIKIIYEGFAKEKKASRSFIAKTKKKYKITDKFILCLGTLEPRKNMPMLIQAFDDLVNSNFKKYNNFQLILAGSKGWKYAPIFKAIKEAKYSRVRYLGYISQAEKIALLSEAAVFAFPTLWEGFGLPVLEAMSLGTPVLASNVSSLPEIVEKAGILINPKNANSIKNGLAKILKSQTSWKKYSHKAKIQAKKFSWKKCAQQTLKSYLEVYKDSIF